MTANDNDRNENGSVNDDLGGVQPPQSPPPVDEDRILAEGKEARIAAGKALAEKAKNDPAILDSKTLARIGADGRAALINALRGDLPKPAGASAKRTKPGNPPAAARKSTSSGMSEKANAANTTASKSIRPRPVSPLGREKGWWHDQPRLSPEGAALMWGCGLGAGIIAVFIVAFRTMPY